ncbi:MAG: hypothetical protein AB8B85_14535 [Paracoccaceae bacterium]
MRNPVARVLVSRLAAGIMIATAGTAHAAVVLDCGDLAPTEALIEPWEENTRTFSRGSIRLAAIDLGDPPCCPQHFIVTLPANMYGGRICALVARSVLVPNGWTRVGIGEAEASRPATGGLRLTVPVYGYDPTTGGADTTNRQTISVRVRQAAGTVELDTAQ